MDLAVLRIVRRIETVSLHPDVRGAFKVFGDLLTNVVSILEPRLCQRTLSEEERKEAERDSKHPVIRSWALQAKDCMIRGAQISRLKKTLLFLDKIEFGEQSLGSGGRTRRGLDRWLEIPPHIHAQSELAAVDLQGFRDHA